MRTLVGGMEPNKPVSFAQRANQFKGQNIVPNKAFHPKRQMGDRLPNAGMDAPKNSSFGLNY